MFSEVGFGNNGESSSAQSSSAEILKGVQPSGKGEFLSISLMCPIREDEDRPSGRSALPSPSVNLRSSRNSFSLSPIADPGSGEEMPSWLPSVLLRLTKLEQRAEARDRADLARKSLPPSREGDRVNQLINQKRTSAPGGSESTVVEVG